MTPESNATLGSKGEAVVTIENDDAVPSVSISDNVTINEGETATLTVTLSNPSAQTINVNYSISDGTATIGDNDYVTPTTSTITFAPGETSKTITVVSQQDSKFESDETFKVQLTPESNATLGSKGEAVVTIENDDAVPSVSIEDVTVNEGDTATLTVTLSNPSAQTINVNYSTSDGTATIGDNDYVAPTTSTITFDPGETSKTITVVTQSDSKFELDETFKVQLAPDSNATLGSKGEAVVTIENDDAVPSVSIEDVTVNEGETATLTVTLSNPSAQTINVSYSTSDGTATIGDNDYVTPTTSTITFAPGETSKTITVVSQPDSKFELDETFKVQLAPDSNATLGSKGEAVVTIENDDAVPSVSISDNVTINEGETATLTVTLSNPSAQTINVNYSISDGTATIGDNDYVTPTTSTITFAPGETSKTITVVSQQDSKFESDETFKVQLTPESNATLGSKGEAVVTIKNDDAVPSVSIEDVTVNEGDTATLTVTLSNPSAQTINVSYSISDGTATIGDNDYVTPTASTITFDPGETSKTITVVTQQDSKFELDETFKVQLAPDSNATLGSKGEAVVTIENDDAVPSVSIEDVTVNEGETATLTVTLSNPSAQTINVNYSTSDGTATIGDNDYVTPTASTITFDPGETSKTITVVTQQDSKFELDETFKVQLVPDSNATLGSKGEAVVTIKNDDAVPSVSIEDVTVNEGETATLTVTLSNPSAQTINVNYSTSDGTATIGDNDYVAHTASTITFAPGETSKTITVVTQQDNKFELDETFKVQLVPDSNATLGSKGEAVVTIENDDAVPSVSIEDVTVNEGETATLTVTLSNPSAQTINVNYSTSDGTATIGDNDYVVPTTSTITFDPGETSKTITVVSQPDSKFELDETFKVQLAPDSNATLGSKGEAVVTIENDDAVPSVSIEDVTVNEGETATLTVTLSNPSAQTINVNYSTSDGTATIGDNDYVVPTASTITFAPGETSKTITVVTQQDSKFELDETFKVQLAPESNATLGSKGEAIVTIKNDDALPSISISDDVTINEGGTATFTLTLSNPTAQFVTVNYATSDGSATSVDADYEVLNVSTLAFAPGETSKTISVVTKQDNKFEVDETFSIQFFDPSNASLTKSQATVTIANDDAPPSIKIDDVRITEGSNANFTITLSNPSSQQITVNYNTSDGSATTVDGDYEGLSGASVVFAPGETSKIISVVTKDDNIFELDETFNVNLSTSSNATFEKATGIATVTSEDLQPSISIDEVAIAGENNTATFNVTLSNPSTQQITVNYKTSNGSAIADTDYNALNDILTFAPGETTKTISVVTKDDNIFEADETFNIELFTPSNATLAKDKGLVVIISDDPKPTVSISDDVTVTEGGTATFTLTVSNPSSQPIIVNYTTSDGTATVVDNDYNAVKMGTITFAPGEMSKTIDIVTKSDKQFETDEKFNVNFSLAPESNATLSKNQAIVTVTNDDPQPTISIQNTLLKEGDTANFSVTLSNPSYEVIEVSYNTADGSATIADGDYIAGTNKLIFNPTETNKTISIATNIDAKIEDVETFSVILSEAKNATISINKGIGVINIPTILNGTSGPDLLVGTQNSDRIYGLEDNDTIIGGLGFDEIDAGDGDDTVFGDTVNSVSNSTSINSDVIKGGNGNDRIFGGDGDDWVYGEAGDDLLWGNDGQDLLWGGAGNDYLTGGQGNDRFVLASGEGTDTINDFHVGEDVIYLVNGLKLSDLSRTTFLGSTLIYENSQENSDRKILAIITGVNSSALTDSSFVVQ
ncbi:Calx-beta domain-containing protein [Tolypothrix bouteillei VB521301_2]|uniref:Calx-beta domain-containing protein n=1 Tax=Tolypothrix bouteillei TaxID=1246981 RepID=UPI0038B44816